MLSTILRTYFNPEENDSVVIINYPHVMYYAPNVSAEDIGGGKLGGLYPFVIMPGHLWIHDPAIDFRKERPLTKEYSEMLERLCKIKEVWCLPKEKKVQH